jgi:hypothetical protein
MCGNPFFNLTPITLHYQPITREHEEEQGKRGVNLPESILTHQALKSQVRIGLTVFRKWNSSKVFHFYADAHSLMYTNNNVCNIIFPIFAIT